MDKFEAAEEIQPIGDERISGLHLLKGESDYYLVEFENATCDAIRKEDLPRDHALKIALYMEDRIWH